MPDVTVYMPKALRGVEVFCTDLTLRLMNATAKHLTCLGYDSELVTVNPEDVDVFLRAYEYDTKTGSLLVIKVEAYDYPDRMANIGDRLQSVMAEGIPPEMISIAGMKRGSISFIPLRNGCWQSTPA